MATYYNGRELAPGEHIPCACCKTPILPETSPKLLGNIGGYCELCNIFAARPVMYCPCPNGKQVFAAFLGTRNA